MGESVPFSSFLFLTHLFLKLYTSLKLFVFNVTSDSAFDNIQQFLEIKASNHGVSSNIF